jgi:hypothetical protein
MVCLNGLLISGDYHCVANHHAGLPRPAIGASPNQKVWCRSLVRGVRFVMNRRSRWLGTFAQQTGDAFSSTVVAIFSGYLVWQYPLNIAV